MLRLGITAVRLAPVVAPALVISAVFLIAGDIYTAQPAGLTVHEWGTFTSVAGEDGSAIDWDALGCKDDLPRFVYGNRAHGNPGDVLLQFAGIAGAREGCVPPRAHHGMVSPSRTRGLSEKKG